MAPGGTVGIQAGGRAARREGPRERRLRRVALRAARVGGAARQDLQHVAVVADDRDLRLQDRRRRRGVRLEVARRRVDVLGLQRELVVRDDRAEALVAARAGVQGAAAQQVARPVGRVVRVDAGVRDLFGDERPDVVEVPVALRDRSVRHRRVLDLPLVAVVVRPVAARLRGEVRHEGEGNRRRVRVGRDARDVDLVGVDLELGIAGHLAVHVRGDRRAGLLHQRFEALALERGVRVALVKQVRRADGRAALGDPLGVEDVDVARGARGLRVGQQRREGLRPAQERAEVRARHAGHVLQRLLGGVNL